MKAFNVSYPLNTVFVDEDDDYYMVAQIGQSEARWILVAIEHLGIRQINRYNGVNVMVPDDRRIDRETMVRLCAGNETFVDSLRLANKQEAVDVFARFVNLS